MKHRLASLALTCFALALPGCRPAAAPADVPEPDRPLEVREGYASNNGDRLYYRTVGSGEPIFILHGGPGMDHTYLLPQMDRLAQYFQLVYLDQRLCGKSAVDVAPETVTFKTFVEDIEVVREALGLEKIHLLGHSWGGLIAMHYAIAHPDRLESLILANSVAARADLWQEENSLLAARLTPEDEAERQRILESAAFKAGEPSAFAELYRLGFRLQFHDPARVEELTLTPPADLRERSMKLSAIGPELEGYDLTEQLKALDRPTLIVYGDAEASAGISGPHLANTIPGARLTILGRSGHFPYIENADAFFATVREFVNES